MEARAIEGFCSPGQVAFALALVFVVSGCSSKSVSNLMRKAQQGDASAQCNLGNLYAGGHGVVRDFAAAAEWYRKAAEQGHADAE